MPETVGNPSVPTQADLSGSSSISDQIGPTESFEIPTTCTKINKGMNLDAASGKLEGQLGDIEDFLEDTPSQGPVPSSIPPSNEEDSDSDESRVSIEPDGADSLSSDPEAKEERLGRVIDRKKTRSVGTVIFHFVEYPESCRAILKTHLEIMIDLINDGRRLILSEHGVVVIPGPADEVASSSAQVQKVNDLTNNSPEVQPESQELLNHEQLLLDLAKGVVFKSKTKTCNVGISMKTSWVRPEKIVELGLKYPKLTPVELLLRVGGTHTKSLYGFYDMTCYHVKKQQD
ncbi:MAG: hypothetical protein FuRV4_gp2 [Hangzhou rhabdovirus 4]|uniref:Uncharacterized protein n=1 Tax=Hangzhou rhabdovirus 4 TaxID=2905393 RepID=A0A8K1XB52_9RHAB|nr:MAG: hypothetical protein FuRV4_gp2 [Hangzhou rhabdovirus 4]